MVALWAGFFGILIGTVTDLRTREVPDWVNYGMIGAGVALGVFSALLTWSVWPVLYAASGLLAGFLVGVLMYYTGQWGGGDAKMIMGLGALIGLPFLPRDWTGIPLFVLFLACTVVVGALYGMAWMAVLFVRHRRDILPALNARLHSPWMIRVRYAVYVLVVLAVVLGLFLPVPYRVVLWVLAALAYLTFLLGVSVNVIEAVCFVKEVPVGRLVEGDWVVGSVIVRGKVLVPEKNPGLTKQQIALLMKQKVKTVRVKEGIPFVPSFLIAYLLAWWWSLSGVPFLG